MRLLLIAREEQWLMATCKKQRKTGPISQNYQESQNSKSLVSTHFV